MASLIAAHQNQVVSFWDNHQSVIIRLKNDYEEPHQVVGSTELSFFHFTASFEAFVIFLNDPSLRVNRHDFKGTFLGSDCRKSKYNPLDISIFIAPHTNVRSLNWILVGLGVRGHHFCFCPAYMECYFPSGRTPRLRSYTAVGLKLGIWTAPKPRGSPIISRPILLIFCDL